MSTLSRDDFTRREVIAVLALITAVAVVAFVGGSLVGPESIPFAGTQSLSEGPAEIPDAAAGPPVSASGHAVEFTRPETDTQLFDFRSHDAMLTVENGTYYLVTGTNRRQKLYRSETPTDPDSWTLLDGDYLTRAYEYDSWVEVDGRYVAYADRGIYTTSSLTADDWTRRRDGAPFRDLGAYYDEETGLVHVYYESGVRSQSGVRIGHAVSPNGVSNWTVYPPVWTAPDGMGVGDFEIVERGDRVIILGDYGPKHPRYDVGVWVNDDFYTEFTKLDEPAIGRRDGSTPYGDDYGIGDPTLAPLGDGRYLMVVNGHPDAVTKTKLHYYVGTITTPNATADGRNDSAAHRENQ